MLKAQLFFILLIIVSVLFSCDKNSDIDTQKPQIENSFSDAFPLNCDTIYFGESFDLKLLFKDNVELGSYSLDIHNNFDHHSHSTDFSECVFIPQKEPINPYLLIEDFNIESGQNEYLTNNSISIPNGNDIGDFDEGDYHLFISLTDKEGWSAQKGINIKILHR